MAALRLCLFVVFGNMTGKMYKLGDGKIEDERYPGFWLEPPSCKFGNDITGHVCLIYG